MQFFLGAGSAPQGAQQDDLLFFVQLDDGVSMFVLRCGDAEWVPVSVQDTDLLAAVVLMCRHEEAGDALAPAMDAVPGGDVGAV